MQDYLSADTSGKLNISQLAAEANNHPDSIL